MKDDMPKIYLDTNVFHYFGRAFAEESVVPEIASDLLIAPLSLMELLSQLGTRNAEGAFLAIQALLRVHDKQATGLLPWSDDFFRMSIFGLSPGTDVITTPLNNAVNNVLNTSDFTQLAADGLEMRKLLDTCKAQASAEFSAVIDAWRIEGPLDEKVHREIFAHAIGRRAKVAPSAVDVNVVIERLSALYTFECERMKAGASNYHYNVTKRANDAYDAELLIYLAEPSFHFVTSDDGFKRVSDSMQADRIHIIDPLLLSTSTTAVEALYGILSS